jgi:flagellar motor switch protein FliG
MKAVRARGGEISKRSATLSKAAIVMMALDDERLQRIFGRLAEDEVRRLSFAMSSLGRVDVGMVEVTLAELKAEVGQTCNIIGNVETTEKLLRRLMSPEKADELIEEIQGPNGKNIWEKLSHIPPAMLAGYLRNEYPQTAAAILSQLPAQHAARVLRLLPERLVGDVAVRMVRMNSVQRAVVTDIEETLKREFSSELSRSYGRDSTSVMAEILNRSSKDVLERVMAALETSEPEAAARVRRIMFTFDDLRRVDTATFGMLIAECPADKLPVALAGASTELRELFLSYMSERAGNLLREEMAMMPAPRHKVVEDAQAEIVALAKRMAEEGRIAIIEEDEEEEGFVRRIAVPLMHAKVAMIAQLSLACETWAMYNLLNPRGFVRMRLTGPSRR